MQPRANDMRCVIADTCGSRSIRAFIVKKVMTVDPFHQLLLNDGVLSPTKAKMILEKPTTSADVQNHDAVAMINAITSGVRLYLTPWRKRFQIEKLFTAR